jgi:hypothetical protein
MSDNNIPPADEPFNTWVVPFSGYVTTNAVAMGVAPADAAALAAKVTTWNSMFPTHNTARAAATAATTNKNLSREGIEALARPLIQQLQASTTVTDAQRNLMQINVRSTAHTPASVPTTMPIAMVDTSQRLRHIVSYTDSASGGSKKKPAGVASCEVWAKVGAPAPTDISQMAYMGNASTSPQMEEYTGAQAGQMVCYWLRWVNTRGEKGPWSEPVTATIAG